MLFLLDINFIWAIIGLNNRTLGEIDSNLDNLHDQLHVEPTRHKLIH